MTAMNKLLIYGAAGYTGQIIAARAKELNLHFEIAGREADKITTLASELGVSYHVFTVDDTDAWEKALAGKTVLLNTAGPFRFTARQAMEACLRANVHYLTLVPNWKLTSWLNPWMKKLKRPVSSSCQALACLSVMMPWRYI
jgi:short subunit dehydrogenase-like uncharacterized protein